MPPHEKRVIAPQEGPQTKMSQSSADIVIGGGSAGGGKGFRPNQPVLTPFGYRPISKLKVGSRLCAVDGSVTKVIAVYHRGIQDFYRIKWSDGTQTECDSDHLWLLWTAGKSRKICNERTFGEESAKKWTTLDVFEHYQNGGRNLIAPVVSKPVAFNCSTKKHIDPYLLGVLLGDGCLTRSATFTSADQQIVENVSSVLGVELSAVPSTEVLPAKEYSIGRFVNSDLRNLGLIGIKSHQKFIPRSYFLADIDSRWAILQGLMDTDGWAEEDGDTFFTSVSKQLADDVTFIARSLGAIVFTREKWPTFTDEEGNKKTGQKAHTLRIKIDHPERLFRLDRKRKVCESKSIQSMGVKIESIEKVDPGKSICIAVEHPTSLFVVENFKVTHNTWFLEFEPLRHINNPGFRAVIVRKSTVEITDEGGLWDESYKLYPLVGGTPKIQKLRWHFPSGARIRFRHLENQNLKVEWKGTQAAYIGFDQLEDMTEEAFFYLMSRNRSTCGVKPYIRATCNPQPGWLANFLAWWIDQETGFPIPERDGVIRWMVRDLSSGDIEWYDSEKEAMDDNPELVAKSEHWRPKSVTFIRATLEDNKVLMTENPEYLSDLMMLPRIERMRLYDGNWKISSGSQIDYSWVRKFGLENGVVSYAHAGNDYRTSSTERFAIIDTAGTSKQKAAEKRGKKPSYSCATVVDYDKGPDMLLVQDVWRTRVSWTELVSGSADFLKKWKVKKVLIENAHFGQALAAELKKKGFNVKLVGPTVKDQQSGRGSSAKLERAVASKLLSRLEMGQILFTPDKECWPESLTSQLTAWTGLDDEVADLVDVLSYASDYKRASTGFFVS